MKALATGAFAIYRREMLSLWVTPLAWVLLAAFLLVQGGIFYSIVLHFSQMTELSLDTGPLEAYFGQHSVLISMTLLLVCPALSMRTFAEEHATHVVVERAAAGRVHVEQHAAPLTLDLLQRRAHLVRERRAEHVRGETRGLHAHQHGLFPGRIAEHQRHCELRQSGS